MKEREWEREVTWESDLEWFEEESERHMESLYHPDFPFQPREGPIIHPSDRIAMEAHNVLGRARRKTVFLLNFRPCLSLLPPTATHTHPHHHLRVCAAAECQKAQTSDVPLKMCRICGQRFYCSKECQKSDWKARHKAECPLLKNAPSHSESTSASSSTSPRTLPDGERESVTAAAEAASGSDAASFDQSAVPEGTQRAVPVPSPDDVFGPLFGEAEEEMESRPSWSAEWGQNPPIVF